MARTAGPASLNRASGNRADATWASGTDAGSSRAGLNRGRQITAAGLLGAACCAWAAIPLLTGALWTALLIVTVLFVLADVLRLATAMLPISQVDVFSSLGLRVASRAYALLNGVPSAEAATVAVLILEVSHASRPWHTGVLGAALVCYLFATHLAETGASPRVLRPQLPALAAGLGLLILGTAAALVPAAAPSLGSGLLRVLAAVAAIVAGALALPL
jgi:hypothetical protein